MVDAGALAFLIGLGLAAARISVALGLGGAKPWAVGGMALAVGLVPVAGVPLGGYLRALVGDLSVTTLVVLAAGMVRRPDPSEWRVVAGLVTLAAVFLYPLALGLGPYDPYRLGFAPIGLLGVLLLLALFAGWTANRLLAVVLIAAVSAYGVGVLESSNLWDYLLDPWIAGLSGVYLLRRTRRGVAAQDEVGRGAGHTSRVG